MNDTVLGASSIPGGVGSLPARSVVHTEREVASEIVIAVAGLTEAVGAADDNVGGEGLAGAKITIRLVGWADVLTGGRVVGELSRREGSRCRDEERCVEHFDFGWVGSCCLGDWVDGDEVMLYG